MLFACGGEPEPRLCNGHEAFCTRSLAELSLVRTHNSHASEERGYNPFAMNHYRAIPTQLAEGVRALNVDIYEEDGVLVACHGSCELGSQPVEEIWSEISVFLAENPDEVLVLDVQDEAPTGAVNASVAAHELGSHGWKQQPGEPWPALEEMLDEGGRLVFFNTPAQGDPAWVLDPSAFVYGTGWHYLEAEDLDCAVQTEVLDHGLYEVTHVLTNPIASPVYAEEINHQPVIGEHLGRCQDEVGLPNLVSVDYYSIGDVFEAADDLNGI